jgi:hypothetical protein
MRRVAVIVLATFIAMLALLAVPYFLVGPDWGRQAAEAVNESVRSRDWGDAGTRFADTLFGGR